VQEVEAGCLSEQRAGNEGCAGKPRRREAQFARLLLGRRDQLLDVLGGIAWIDNQHEWDRAQPCDAGKILHRVERSGFCNESRNRVPVRCDHQRVAVGRRLGDTGGAGKARPVFNDYLLAPALVHLLGENARQDIGDAPGSERHDHGDALGGIILRQARGGANEQRRECGEQHSERMCAVHCVSSCADMGG
jgi:hypothetical protein